MRRDASSPRPTQLASVYVVQNSSIMMAMHILLSSLAQSVFAIYRPLYIIKVHGHCLSGLLRGPLVDEPREKSPSSIAPAATYMPLISPSKYTILYVCNVCVPCLVATLSHQQCATCSSCRQTKGGGGGLLPSLQLCMGRSLCAALQGRGHPIHTHVPCT